MGSLNDQADLALRIRRDPVRFVRDFFGESLLGKQAEVLESVRDNSDTFVRSAHDVGKTFLAARTALWFLMAHPGDAIVITTAPTWGQVEGQLWRELASAYAKSKVRIGGRLLTTRLELGAKWYAIGLATDPGTAVNLQGYHASRVLVVMDEADGIAPQIWTALDSVRTSAGAKLLAIGNPLDPTSEFKKRHDSAGADAKTIKIAADDVLPLTDGGKYPYLLQRAWVEEKRERWGESSALYQGKVLAEWPDQGSDTLIPISWLMRARARTVQLGPRVLGVDVARFGAARSVRTLLAGNQLVFSRATEKEDTMTTAGRVYTDIETYAPISTAIDDGGVGGAVTDRLRQMTKYVTAVNFGGAAHDSTRFVNRGSEMYWHLRQAFEENLIGLATDNPDSVDELIADLNRPKYLTDERGRIRVDKYGVGRGHTEASLSDEDRVARSPDRGDSFVLAYSVLPRSLSEIKLHVDDRSELQKRLDDSNRRDMQMLTQGWTPEMDRDS
jgi:phage terminase large subunit